MGWANEGSLYIQKYFLLLPVATFSQKRLQYVQYVEEKHAGMLLFMRSHSCSIGSQVTVPLKSAVLLHLPLW